LESSSRDEDLKYFRKSVKLAKIGLWSERKWMDSQSTMGDRIDIEGPNNLDNRRFTRNRGSYR
jgi:putative ubiquitin-RnfH superfamily antitoxin RatB of RatAB toxin-antitoxin module